MVLDLKIVGENCLTEPSVTIDNITEDIIKLSNTMKRKMVEWSGVGLAAPQVGHNIRLIIIRTSTGTIQEMINPKIRWSSDKEVDMMEGCLSIPGKSIWLNRPSKLRIKFQTIDGDFKYWSIDKMDARVFLHEYDHLEGILMTDRL